MTTKTRFSKPTIEVILSRFVLGSLMDFKAIPQGTVQTNYLLETTKGKYILRYYENRSLSSVIFESDLLAFLTSKHFPCPHPVIDKTGKSVGLFQHKPFSIFEYIEGQPVERLTTSQKCQLINKVAELQNLSKDFNSIHQDSRWNYSKMLCRELAEQKSNALNNPEAGQKLTWIKQQLSLLDFPDDLPKGICHCDFHFSNILFLDDQLVGLIDFDDANYTYLTFDLVCLIDTWAWHYPAKELDLQSAQEIVHIYEATRPLSPIEKRHFLDVYILSILFDSIWFFSRGKVGNFYEQIKIDFLRNLGRRALQDKLFYY